MRNFDRELKQSAAFFDKEGQNYRPKPYAVPEKYSLPMFSLAKPKETFIVSNKNPESNALNPAPSNLPFKLKDPVGKPNNNNSVEIQNRFEDRKENTGFTRLNDLAFTQKQPSLAFLSKYAVEGNNSTVFPSKPQGNTYSQAYNPPLYPSIPTSKPFHSTCSPPYQTLSLPTYQSHSPPYQSNDPPNPVPINQPKALPNSRPSDFDSIRPLQRNYEIADVLKWTESSFPWDRDLLDLMKNLFGIPSFRPNQKAIMNATLNKKDVFVCMPTGAGKSLCFQLPALKDPGITLVIMPLISLIFDQISQLKSLGIEAIGLAGQAQISSQELKSISQPGSDLRLLYSTPEKLEKCPWFIEFLRSLYSGGRLSRIVIDEAHCVSHWGRDFRPDYLLLGKLRESFPGVPIMALTATATELVRKDVIQNLKITGSLYFQSSFNRPNLFYEVRAKPSDEKTIENIRDFIVGTYPKRSGIIYCTTIKEAEKVARVLSSEYGLSCAAYHASLPEKTRRQVQEDWMVDEVLIVVATIAFGMGINKPNVRFVIHFSLSKSIENYYQESGRAGRDGKPSHCIVYYRFKDRLTLYFLMAANSQGGSRDGRRALVKMMEFLEDERDCRREAQLRYFGERFDRERCGKLCDNCRRTIRFEPRDFSAEYRKIEPFLQGLAEKKLTFRKLEKTLAGKQNKKASFAGDSFGILGKEGPESLAAFLKHLLFKEVLVEKTIEVFGHSCTYVHFNRPLAASEGEVYLKDLGSELLKSKAKKQGNENPPNNRPNRKEHRAAQQKNPQAQRNEEFLDPEITEHLDKFIYSEKAREKEAKVSSNPPSVSPKRKLYHPDFGYCTPEQFEEILERLTIIRKQIFKRSQDPTCGPSANIDDIFPLVGLEELSRKLPTLESELTVENIKNVGAKPMRLYGGLFLQEIEHFIKINGIDKSGYEVPAPETVQKPEVFDYETNCVADPDPEEVEGKFPGPYEEDEGLLEEIDLLINGLKET